MFVNCNKNRHMLVNCNKIYYMLVFTFFIYKIVHFAKFGASSYAGFLTHASPPESVYDLLKNDAMGTLFLRE
jgi:hypothetical protein